MVYLLYGTADRDRTELVCMIFPDRSARADFEIALPGRYRRAILRGVNYDAIEFEPETEWFLNDSALAANDPPPYDQDSPVNDS